MTPAAVTLAACRDSGYLCSRGSDHGEEKEEESWKKEEGRKKKGRERKQEEQGVRGLERVWRAAAEIEKRGTPLFWPKFIEFVTKNRLLERVWRAAAEIENESPSWGLEFRV